jgi:hypothetical protein
LNSILRLVLPILKASHYGKMDFGPIDASSQYFLGSVAIAFAYGGKAVAPMLICVDKLSRLLEVFYLK